MSTKNGLESGYGGSIGKRPGMGVLRTTALITAAVVLLGLFNQLDRSYWDMMRQAASRPVLQVLSVTDLTRDPCEEKHVTGEPQPAPTKELVLVTGGAGFIGSNLVELLLKLGYRVRVMDNLYTGDRAYLDATAPDLEFMFGDITRYADCVKALQGGVVGVFHLAAMSKVLPSMKDVNMARFCMDNNVVGTHNVLQAALLTGGVRKVVYAASSTAYGNNPVPQHERMLPDLQTPYASSKYMAELLMKEFDDVFKLPTLSIRFFMVYGKRQPATGAYAIVTGRFVDMLKKGEPLRIEGDGEQSRDFIHVSDIARALVLGFQSTARGMTINAGTGTDYSVNYLADLVSQNRYNAPARPFDLRRTLADTCLAKEMLQFEAQANFTASMMEEVKLAQLENPPGLRSDHPVVDAEMVIYKRPGDDLEWVNDTSLPLMRQFIYDESSLESGDSLPLGLESLTIPYVYHIVKHYHKLPTVVIFTQGAPEQHVGSLQKFGCLIKLAMSHQPDFVGMATLERKNTSASFADDFLKALDVPKRDGALLAYIAFASSKAAIHRHPREWWMQLWERLTDVHGNSTAIGKDSKGGDGLVERYWPVFLDPEDQWEAKLSKEANCN